MSSPPETVPPSTTDPATASTSPGDVPRRTSFGFLRRQKSTEQSSGTRSASGGKMTKKQRAQAELLRKQSLPQSPPRLPSHSPLPRMNILGGGAAGAEDPNARPDSYAIISNKASGYPGDFYQHGGVRPSGEFGSNPHGVPIPPIPSSSPARNGEVVDPYARTESMTHRGRYSYASSAVSTLNSPRRVRRRKDPTPFNILVVGAKNSGKTSFINFLKSSLQLPARKQRQHTPSPPTTALPPDSAFTSIYLESEIDNERIGVTLWDSKGLEKNIVDLQLREMDAFLESKFEETFTEEQKVIRAPGVRDTHIHCVFLILDPVRLDANIAALRENQDDSATAKFGIGPRLVGGLDEDLDIQVLRGLQGKTTVIPVISKADTITTAHMAMLKKTVWDSLKQAKLDPLEYLTVADSDLDETFDEREEDEYLHSDADEQRSAMLNKIADGSSDEDEDDVNGTGDVSSPVRDSSPATSSPPRVKGAKEGGHRRTPSAMSMAAANAEADDVPYLPLSIISPDSNNPEIIGRAFPWGFADPYNPDHCDFVRLKESVFTEWRAELREASREIWYEGWRTSRLKRRGTSAGAQSAPPKSARIDPNAGYDSGSVRSRTNGTPETQRYRAY